MQACNRTIYLCCAASPALKSAGDRVLSDVGMSLVMFGGQDFSAITLPSPEDEMAFSTPPSIYVNFFRFPSAG